MTELQAILNHVNAIRDLLLSMQKNETINEETCESINVEELSNEPKRCRSLFNSTKFLNKDERQRVLDFMNDDVMNQINKQPAHKQVSFTQQLLKDKCNVSVSNYMTNKLLQYKNTNKTIREDQK